MSGAGEDIPEGAEDEIEPESVAPGFNKELRRLLFLLVAAAAAFVLLYFPPVGGIVRDLLTLGREISAHVVILVQINRQGDQIASIRHLANSDEIGRAAHHVLILNRPQEKPTDTWGLRGEQHIVPLDIDVTSRGRGTGCTIPVMLNKTQSRFDDNMSEAIR